jgi:hypothetical protein
LELLSRARASEALIEKVPRTIQTFVDAFQGLELRQKKAQLQIILKAATISEDGRIELESAGRTLNPCMFYVDAHVRAVPGHFSLDFDSIQLF